MKNLTLCVALLLASCTDGPTKLQSFAIASDLCSKMGSEVHSVSDSEYADSTWLRVRCANSLIITVYYDNKNTEFVWIGEQ